MRRRELRRRQEVRLLLIGVCVALFLSAVFFESRLYPTSSPQLRHSRAAQTIRSGPARVNKDENTFNGPLSPPADRQPPSGPAPSPPPFTSLSASPVKPPAAPPSTHVKSSVPSPALPVVPQAALPDAAIILFCYNRSNYLQRTLESLSALEGLDQMTVYISQDGNDESVHTTSLSFGQDKLAPPYTRHFEHWQRERIPQLHASQPGHAWLAQHYKWGLDKVFTERKHSHAIVIEDDMLFSPDFLTFFFATGPLLDRDPSLWCISTWNDNGLKYFDWDEGKLFRTSYFPGLGWMLRRQLWEELGPKFPRQAWDHWMRLDGTSRGRECISPEVNRNFNIGEIGANMQKSIFTRHFSNMAFHRGPANATAGLLGGLAYLEEGPYTAHLAGLLQGARVWEGPLNLGRLQQMPTGQVHLLVYKGEAYPRIARVFKIWPFPRGHHRHIIALPYKGSTWLLADVRFCPLLPPELRVLPSPLLKPLAAAPNTSCSQACRSEGLTCSQEDFWFINTCEELAKHFPCSAGCAVELGPDVPNYVIDPSLATYQTCLVTQQAPRCSAAHRSTQRLCPCVPT